MNGRQVRTLSVAGHRFLAVVDPRIRGMDCGDAAASDEPRSAEGRPGLVDTVRPRRGCDQIESERPEWCRWEAQPTPARLSDGLVRLVASPISASWNHLYLWIRAVDGLRRAA